MFDETGANNQDHSATFVVTSSVLDPAKYPLFADSRSVADWLRPGAAPFSPYSGPHYMSAGADSQAYKRLGKTLDLTGATTPKLDFKFSADVEADWDWVVVEVRDVTTNPNSDAWTTLPEADTDGAGDRRHEPDHDQHGRRAARRASGRTRDAPHPFLLHYWSPTCEPHGHDRRLERVHRLHRRLDGLDRRPVGVRGQEGRPADQRDHRLGHAGPRRLGRRHRGSPTAPRRSSSTTSRRRSAAGPSARRRPAPTSRPTAGSGARRSSRRAASSPPTTRSTPGSASRASTSRRATSS